MSEQPKKPETHIEYLYVDTPTIHPRVVKGLHRSLKTWLGVVLLGLTAFVPWIRWDRGPDMPSQAIMFSFADMRAYIFDTVIWAQQFYLLTGVLILACLVLFLATAVYGRVWCGMACPQTVWTDLFVRIERLAEGDRNARLKLEQEPWTANKIARKVYKHALWLVVSAITGIIFLGFFTDIVQVVKTLPTGEASATIYGFFALFAGGTYVMAGWVREQMCIYMCPWPRIQGGMLDEFTLNVAYDQARGEPRAHAKRGVGFENRGHCVDCNMCVQACPTGIDIREGAQMACINCGLCIDACDAVMTRFNLPTKLIGWRNLSQGDTQIQPKLLRPRTLIYIGLIVVVSLGILVATDMRREIDLSVLADRSPSSVRLGDGSVRDGFTVKMVNRRHETITGQLTVTGIPGIHLSQLSGEQSVDVLHVTADPDTVTTIRVFIHQDADAPKSDHASILFSFNDGVASAKSVFQVDQVQ